MEKPDGGYSWVVAGCCSFVHFALFGIFRSAGVMYVAMLHNYDVTREEASWPFALAAGVFQLTSPITGILTHYISQRKACLLGSAIATIGMAGCYFAESITWINIFYGIIHGFGFGILATLLTVTLNQYFVKYRATAIGFAFAGGSISTLVFPIVMEWLLENYSLNDSFLLLSGLVMNTLVAASLLRIPPWMKKPKRKKTYEVKVEEHKYDVIMASNASNKHHVTPETQPTVYCDAQEETNHFPKYQMAVQSDSEDCDREDSGHIRVTSSTASVNKLSDCSPDNSHSPESFSDVNDTLRSNNDSVLFEGSYSKLNTVTSDNSKNGSVQKSEFEVREPLLICDNKNTVIVPKKEIRKDLPEKTGIRHSVSSILKQPIFYKLAFTMCVYFLGVHSTFMVIVDFAKDKGIPEENGVYIISMFSLTDLIGRAGLGWVTDRNYVGRKDMVCLNLAILGIVYLLYPLIDALPGILAIAAVQGLAVGCSITLFFVIQVESMGLDKLTLVVGLTSFINGIASFLRPGIIGLFRDVIGSYNWMFHLIGGATLIFALIWFVESYQSRRSVVCDEKV